MSETKEDGATGPKECKVLILGGVGFIGRNLVKYLVDNKLVSFIRVADKSLPATGYLSEDHAAAFADKTLVEFKQADLAKADHCNRVFADHKFNYVFNLCGETRFGCSEGEYKLKCEETTGMAVSKAKEVGIDKWIECSTAQVYDADKKPSTEAAALKPWTLVAKSRLAAEERVKASGVDYVILRPATVYGPGDLTGLSPRILCAVAYCILEEKMKFLWGEGLCLNTVHVRDVSAALWACAENAKPGSVYNLADQTGMDQGKLNALLGSMFSIEVGFFGSMLSNMAKMNLAGVANDANDKHVPAFVKACESAKILNTPLSPYLDKELLFNNSLSIDGSAITKDLEFTYSHPTCTEELIVEQVKGFEKQGLFPPGFLGRPKKTKK